MLRQTPNIAKIYLLMAALILAAIPLATNYEGHTGRILVAGVRIPEGPFGRSVLYIAKHDFFRAFGFTLNKAADEKLLEELFGDKPPKAKIYAGGPVGYGTFYLVFTVAENGQIVIEHIGSLDNPPPEYELDFIRDREDLHIVLGYAGWTVFQLNTELLRGSWDVLDYDPALLFNTPQDHIWQKAREGVLETEPVKDAADFI